MKGVVTLENVVGSSLICADDYEAYIRLRFGKENFVYSSIFADYQDDVECIWSGASSGDSSDSDDCSLGKVCEKFIHHCRPVEGNLTVDDRVVIRRRALRYRRDLNDGDVIIDDSGDGFLDIPLCDIFDKFPLPKFVFGPSSFGEYVQLICFGKCDKHKGCKYYVIDSPVYPEASRNSGFAFSFRSIQDLTYIVFPGFGMFLKQFQFSTVSRVTMFEQLTVFNRDSHDAVNPIGADTMYCGVHPCCMVTLLPDNYPSNRYCPEILSPGMPSVILYPGHFLRIRAGQRYQVATLGGFMRISVMRESIPLDLANGMFNKGVVRCFIPSRCDFCVPYSQRPDTSRSGSISKIPFDFVYGYNKDDENKRVVYLN